MPDAYSIMPLQVTVICMANRGPQVDAIHFLDEKGKLAEAGARRGNYRPVQKRDTRAICINLNPYNEHRERLSYLDLVLEHVLMCRRVSWTYTERICYSVYSVSAWVFAPKLAHFDSSAAHNSKEI